MTNRQWQAPEKLTTAIIQLYNDSLLEERFWLRTSSQKLTFAQPIKLPMSFFWRRWKQTAQHCRGLTYPHQIYAHFLRLHVGYYAQQCITTRSAIPPAPALMCLNMNIRRVTKQTSPYTTPTRHPMIHAFINTPITIHKQPRTARGDSHRTADAALKTIARCRRGI